MIESLFIHFLTTKQMKRNTPPEKLLVVSLISVTCLVGTLLASCQKEKLEMEPPTTQISKNYAEEPYLDFASFIEGNNLSNEDISIVLEALKRAHASQIDGWWQMEARSAEEINVSFQVFTILELTIEHRNNLLPDLNSIAIAPRWLGGGIELVPEIPGMRSDCVASCIGLIYSRKTIGLDYAGADTFVRKNYGAAVLLEQMHPCLTEIYGSSRVSMYNLNHNTTEMKFNNSRSEVMIVYQERGMTDGHAVIYFETKADGTHIGLDPQFFNLPVEIKPDQVIGAFEITTTP